MSADLLCSSKRFHAILSVLPRSSRQERVSCTFEKMPAHFPSLKKVSCNTLSFAAVQPRRLVVQSTKSPARSGSIRSKDENLPERQVRELRAFPESNLMGAAALAPSSLVLWRGNLRRKCKVHEGSSPSNTPASENHLHLGKQVCRLYPVMTPSPKRKQCSTPTGERPRNGFSPKIASAAA